MISCARDANIRSGCGAAVTHDLSRASCLGLFLRDNQVCPFRSKDNEYNRNLWYSMAKLIDFSTEPRILFPWSILNDFVIQFPDFYQNDVDSITLGRWGSASPGSTNMTSALIFSDAIILYRR